jgi:TonB-dependent receptor-like protein
MLVVVIVCVLLKADVPSAPPDTLSAAVTPRDTTTAPMDTVVARADSLVATPRAAVTGPDTTMASPDTALARPDTTIVRPGAKAAVPDTAVGAPRVVREFPPVDVRALFSDTRTSQTVREIPVDALRAYPADRLADLVALQPGVVAEGEDLHVRGGRAGETRVVLDGVTLNEPLRHRPMELPLLALRGAELVSGAPESRHVGALAGVLDLHTIDPGERREGEVRWQTDAGLDTRFDRIGGRVSTPIPLLGLGVVAAGEAMLDDTALPALRNGGRHRVLGLSFGWRAENRMLGYLKLAPVAGPKRYSAQVMTSRTVSRPYDAAWSLDGWLGYDELLGLPVWSTTPVPGFVHYHAADHKAITDDRKLAIILTASGTRAARRGTLTLGWLRTRTATSLGGGRTIPDAPTVPVFGTDDSGDAFHIIGGDDPLFRVSGSDMISLRGDAELEAPGGAAIRLGLGASDEDVRLDELDATQLYLKVDQTDPFRTYHAHAPGAFAYGQVRRQSGGVVLNAGLRAEYFTAGPEAERQTLPGSSAGYISLQPRLGLAYPLSARDMFSTSYTRATQTPGRDFLYDRRVTITNRQPLGNPGLRPSRLTFYEAALKHLFGPRWSLQTSLFYRDVAFMIGARDVQTPVPGGRVDPRYTDDDQASSAGFELTLAHDAGGGRRVEAHYTFMHAWGTESRPEGDPYGPAREAGTRPISEQPLSWDRRHALVVSGTWSWGPRIMLAGSSSLGSPLPWTPKPRRQEPTDVTTLNTRRFGWTAATHLGLTWRPPYAQGLTFGLEARNVFDQQGERLATVDGYPNPIINTVFDDYGAYRTETGLGGGAYWTNAGGTGHWVPVHDERLFNPPRAVRASVSRTW